MKFLIRSAAVNCAPRAFSVSKISWAFSSAARSMMTICSSLLGHANISQASTYLQSTAKALGLAIERRKEHERQLAETRRRESEKNSHTETECDNPLPRTPEVSESAEVVKH